MEIPWDLRFIERDGQKILQYWLWGGEWKDVPLVQAEQPVTITRTQFWDAWRAVSEERYLPHCSNAQMRDLASKLGLEPKE